MAMLNNQMVYVSETELPFRGNERILHNENGLDVANHNSRLSRFSSSKLKQTCRKGTNRDCWQLPKGLPFEIPPGKNSKLHDLFPATVGHTGTPIALRQGETELSKYQNSPFSWWVPLWLKKYTQQYYTNPIIVVEHWYVWGHTLSQCRLLVMANRIFRSLLGFNFPITGKSLKVELPITNQFFHMFML